MSMPPVSILRQRRIADVCAVFIATDPHRGDGLFERNVRQRERGTGGANGQDVGVEFGIDRENGGDDLDVVAEAIGEQRPDRTIDLARGQHAVFGRTAFALDVATGDLTGGIHLFFEVARQWEKVDALAGLFGGGNSGKDDVLVAVADQR